jgi:hypothetical protein
MEILNIRTENSHSTAKIRNFAELLQAVSAGRETMGIRVQILRVWTCFVGAGDLRPRSKTHQSLECRVFVGKRRNAAPFLNLEDEDTPAIQTASKNSQLFLKILGKPSGTGATICCGTKKHFSGNATYRALTISASSDDAPHRKDGFRAGQIPVTFAADSDRRNCR